MSDIMPRKTRLRLKDHDYSAPGAYFVTLTVSGMRRVLSSVSQAEPFEPILNDYGKIVSECISLLTLRFPSVKVQCYVIMPNHIHMIIIFTEHDTSLFNVMAWLKFSAGKKILSVNRDEKMPFFSPSYHEHVIRGKKDMEIKSNYIKENPRRWAERYCAEEKGAIRGCAD